MIHIERPEPPEVFSKAPLRAYEVRRTREWFVAPPEQRPRCKFDFRSAGEIPGFMDSLGVVFFNKCAFCETKFVNAQDGALAFFRPREDALQSDRTSAPDHYWWLSWEWSNLYLACALCINAKGQTFPTRNQRARPETYGSDLQSEGPLLLDPCLDDPDHHLIFGENGEASPRCNSDRGLVTINMLDLNRGSLVLARGGRARLVRELLLKCFQANDAGTLASLTEELKSYCNDGQPFAGMVRQLLRGWIPAVNSTPAGYAPQMLSGDPNWRELLERLLPPPDEAVSGAGRPGSVGEAQTKFAEVTYRIAMNEWPRSLVKAVEKGRVIPFAGSGVAMALRGMDGEPLVPDWRGLLNEAADWLEKEEQRPEEAELLRQRLSRGRTFAGAFRTAYEGLGKQFLSFLQDKLDPQREQVDDASLALARTVWRLSSNFVVTIGHDKALRWACPDESALQLIEAAEVSDVMRRLGEGLPHPVLWHAFGTLESGEPIITFDGIRNHISDAGAAARLSATDRSLKELFAGPYPVLFIATSAPRFFSTELFKEAADGHYWLVRQEDLEESKESLEERDLLHLIQPVSFPDYESLPRLLGQLASRPRPDAAAPPPARKHAAARVNGPVHTVSSNQRPEGRGGEALPVEPFDAAIVCALHTPELKMVLTTGGKRWKRLPQKGDPHTYHHTVYKTREGSRLRVVAAAPNQMGLAATAVLATKMIMRFRPRLVAMVGIAAGVKTESQGFGDILAAEHTFDYGAGKVTNKEGKLTFNPDPKPLDIDTMLNARLKEWQRNGYELDDIRRSWPATNPPTALALHVGPLGSGAAVINSSGPVKDVMEHWRKLIGIEMEAYAVHRACKDAVTPAPMYLCLKSICDFAEDKSDDWQPYAAFTAAQLCHRFLVAEWENLFG